MKKNRLNIGVNIETCEGNFNCCGIYELGAFSISDVHGNRQGRKDYYSSPSLDSLKITARKLLGAFVDCEIEIRNSRKKSTGILISCSVKHEPVGSYWWFIKRSLILLGFKEVNAFTNAGSGNKVIVLHMLLTKKVYDALLNLAGWAPEDDWLD